jgi:hypothetical protein
MDCKNLQNRTPVRLISLNKRPLIYQHLCAVSGCNACILSTNTREDVFNREVMSRDAVDARYMERCPIKGFITSTAKPKIYLGNVVFLRCCLEMLRLQLQTVINYIPREKHHIVVDFEHEFRGGTFEDSPFEAFQGLQGKVPVGISEMSLDYISRYVTLSFRSRRSMTESLIKAVKKTIRTFLPLWCITFPIVLRIASRLSKLRVLLKTMSSIYGVSCLHVVEENTPS